MIIFTKVCLSIALLVMCCAFPAAQAANCADLKITDWAPSSTATAGCRLWIDVIPGDYAKLGTYVHATTPSGSVLACEWGKEHVITEVGLDNEVWVWSGNSTSSGDVSGTTLAGARYTRVIFIATYDREVFYVQDSGKLKTVDVAADRVTHVAGNGQTTGNSAALLSSLGPALGATIGGSFQGFVKGNGKVYLAAYIGGESPPAILVFDPELATVSLAVPYQSLPRGQLSAGSFPGTAAYGTIWSIFAPPLTGFDNVDLLIQSRCEKSLCSKKDYIMQYDTETKALEEYRGDTFGTGFSDAFGREGNVAQPQDRATIFYSANAVGRLMKFDVEENVLGLASGIGSATGQEPLSPQWADQVKLGIIYGMAYTPDDKQLWIANRGGTRQTLIRVAWREASSPIPPAQTPVPQTSTPQERSPSTPQPPSSSASSSEKEAADEEDDVTVVAIALAVALAVALVAVGIICALLYRMRSLRQATPVMGEMVHPSAVSAKEMAEQPQA